MAQARDTADTLSVRCRVILGIQQPPAARVNQIFSIPVSTGNTEINIFSNTEVNLAGYVNAGLILNGL